MQTIGGSTRRLQSWSNVRFNLILCAMLELWKVRSVIFKPPTFAQERLKKNTSYVQCNFAFRIGDWMEGYQFVCCWLISYVIDDSRAFSSSLIWGSAYFFPLDFVVA